MEITVENLEACGVDTQKGMENLYASKECYLGFVRDFIQDPAWSELDMVIGTGQWRDAYRVSHTLLKSCEKLGFISLYQQFSSLVDLLRIRQCAHVPERYNELRQNFTFLGSKPR